MDVAMVARNIQVILAPVLMITACAILAQGLLGRYALLTERVRAATRERLELLYEQSGNPGLRKECLRQMAVDLPQLANHSTLAHHGVLALYCAVLAFVSSMFAIAFAAMSGSGLIADIALLLFLSGTAVMLLAIMLTALEVRTSHRAIRDEALRSAGLSDEEVDSAAV